MPRNKIGAIVRCYRLTEYLERVLKSLADVDLIVVANGSFEQIPHAEDDTLEIVRKLKQKNILVYLHEGQAQKDVFNTCMEFMAGMDFVLVNDADEFLLKEDREHIIARMVAKDADAGLCTVIDYAPDGKRYPIRTHKPIVVLRPHARFDGNRSAPYGQGVIEHETYLHHFGHALAADGMKWKTENIWYPAHSFQEVIEQSTEHYSKPDGLVKALNE